MAETVSANQTLGLDLNEAQLKGAQLSLIKNEPQIERLFSLPIEKDEEGNVKPLYIGEESLENLTENCLTITAIPASQILIRHLELNLKKRKDIESVLLFQAEPLLPYPGNDAVLDFSIGDQDKKGTKIIFQSTLKKSLQEQLNKYEMIRVEPEIISSTPSALAAFGYFFSTKPKSTWPQFILFIGQKRTVCVLAKEGNAIASHSFHTSAESLENALLQDSNKQLIEIDFANLNRDETPTLLEAFSDLRMEIGKTLLALAKQHKIENVTEILITGTGATLQNFALSLSKTLQTSITIPEPRSQYSSEEVQKYAIPIGLAIIGLSGWQHPINFRKNEFTHPYPWKRYKKYLMIYGVLCLLLAFAFYLYGSTWNRYQESKLKEQYSSLLEIMGKPYTSFEKEFIAKIQKLPEGQDVEIQPIESLSLDQIESRLEYLEKEIQSIPDIFPLISNAPRVSDFLAWLNTHPNVRGLKEDSTSPLLNIESISYSLVKRPDMKKKQEKYQVKVEIEFSTPVPKLAREFHDALIEPNEIVDPKNEIKWSSARDRYRTSFFLKNR